MGELVRPERVTTVRIPGDLADEVDAICRVDEVTFSDAVRNALRAYVEQHQADQGFVVRLRHRVNLDRAILDRLAGDAADAGSPE